jgi:EmrB/QacA subfamily drug resistance transporter
MNAASLSVVPSETSRGRRDILVLICTSIPSFMLQLDASVVSVSLPAIANSLHASFAGIEWVVTAYVLSFASLLMPAGALADRFGRKPLLIVGLLTFIAASFACGLAPTLPMLILARAIQGSGAAMQLSAALATLSHAFQGPAKARAFSFWGSVVGIGIACGPVVGGLITQYIGWRWAFYVNVPIGVVLIALIWKTIESSKDPGATRLDAIGVLFFAGALLLMTLALIDGNNRGWSDIHIIGECFSAIVLFALFIMVELKQRRPMLELQYFRRSTYIGANLAQFSFSIGGLAMLTFIPIFLQSGLHYTAGSAGLRMLPMVVPLFIVPSLVARHFAHRASGRVLLTVGLALITSGLFCFGLAASRLNYPPLALGMLVIGIGAGILNGETTKVGMTAIPKNRSGMASGVAGTVRFVGVVTGIAGLGVVLYTRVAHLVIAALPNATVSARSALIHGVVAGDTAGLSIPGRSATDIASLAQRSFASGYQFLFLAGAVFLFIATILTWSLVSAHETPPTSKHLDQ